jgi:hypothetical protein
MWLKSFKRHLSIGTIFSLLIIGYIIFHFPYQANISPTVSLEDTRALNNQQNLTVQKEETSISNPLDRWYQKHQLELLYNLRAHLFYHEDTYYQLIIHPNQINHFSFQNYNICAIHDVLDIFDYAQTMRFSLSLFTTNVSSLLQAPFHEINFHAFPTTTTATTASLITHGPMIMNMKKRRISMYFPSSSHPLNTRPITRNPITTTTTNSTSISPITSSSEILIVLTTCNKLSMTILSLQYLHNTAKIADIVIVDDHSTDGTVEYLQKKGFAVIAKPQKATGLTDSWNIGYRLAVSLGYKHVIFTNNDVLLTTGAVHLMHYGLKSHPLVVPLTTHKGSGHHQLQVIYILIIHAGGRPFFPLPFSLTHSD